MPQIKLEYTVNLSPPETDEILRQLHHVLNKLTGIPISNCKSRLIKLDEYLIANGEKNEAFIHLDISLMEGRTKEMKQQIGSECIQLLKAYFTKEANDIDLQITVEIRDINRDFYFKYPEGTI